MNTRPADVVKSLPRFTIGTQREQSDEEYKRKHFFFVNKKEAKKTSIICTVLV
jgi:hypothetical protein